MEESKDVVSTHIDDVRGKEIAADADPEVLRYASDGTHVEIDSALNKALRSKITRRILPIMLVTYFCQSLDKGALNFASIMGIQTDARLVGSDYSWLGTILYLGILVGEYPQNYLLQKLPLSKVLAVNVALWGITVTLSSVCHNFGSLMAVRFLLGLFESCIQPTMMLMTSMWYKREEQLVLNSLWYCMTGLQLMVGGLISVGVSHYDGPIKSWQLLFLILGIFTLAVAGTIAIFLPDSPMKAKCFSEDDKKLMVERVRGNETGIQNRKYKRYQVIEALTDPFVWCAVGLIVVANLIIGGLGVFSNLIIKAFGFSLLQTQLLNIAQGGLTIIVMVGSAVLSQKFGQTCLVMLTWTVPAVAGTAVILAIRPTKSNAPGLLIAFYCTQFFLAQGNLIIALITRNIGGQTKKGVTMTMLFVGWAVGNLTAPQIFQQADAPRYTHGFIAHLCIYGAYTALVIVTRLLLMRRNRQKTAGLTSSADDSNVSHGNGFADMTDRENPNFRYVF